MTPPVYPLSPQQTEPHPNKPAPMTHPHGNFPILPTRSAESWRTLIGRARLWLELRAWGLSLLALFVLFVWLLSAGCASPESAQELAQAQQAMEAVRTDPASTPEDWQAAVLELARAQEAYVRSVHGNAEGFLSGIPASAEGGALGAAVAGLLYLVRQRSRSRLEHELEATHQLAVRALKEATARQAGARGLAGTVEGD